MQGMCPLAGLPAAGVGRCWAALGGACDRLCICGGTLDAQRASGECGVPAGRSVARGFLLVLESLPRKDRALLASLELPVRVMGTRALHSARSWVCMDNLSIQALHNRLPQKRAGCRAGTITNARCISGMS